MTEVLERFFRYVKVDTQSREESETFPSTEKQKDLGRILKRELEEMGASDVRMDSWGYVYAQIPANAPGPALGLISHMDTSEAVSGKDVKPRLVEDYDGGDVVLNEEKGIVLSPADYPEMKRYIGKRLIVTDGTTLLGADDKAGVSEIMTAAHTLLTHPEIRHGKICIAFTPDEEVGRGVDHFDVEGFGAEIAYTVDGGALGEIEYENFNAAAMNVTVTGKSIHPGDAKGRMKNAVTLAMEFQSLLPAHQVPEDTEGYEGFFHVHEIAGDVERTVMKYILRDHDRGKLAEKKRIAQAAADFLNEKYGAGTVSLAIADQYENMKEMILPHPELIDLAKEALRKHGVEPQEVPIRGGTDGARLSYMGLPCPNLCTGGHNFHGRFEYVCADSMETMAQVLVTLAESFARA